MVKVSLLLAGPERSGGPASNNGRPTPDPSFGCAVVCSRVPILLGLFDPVTQNVELQDDAVVHKSINGRSRGHGVLEDSFPFRKRQIAGQQYASALEIGRASCREYLH